MSALAENIDENRPTIMFVDDEERVLKSMRAMFRRDYDVLLANSGAEALELLSQNEIHVVVSDQRMPEMTGVEVLSEIKARSPQTVRILLTGYADLAAVEASINEAEVFKYLMKPCPADEVRGAVLAGLEMQIGTELLGEVVTVPEPSSNVSQLKAAPKAKDSGSTPDATLDKRTESVEVLVYSKDIVMFDGVQKACPTHTLHRATSLDETLALVKKNSIGVLVTDMGVSEKEIADLSVAVRNVTPEIVIILASDRSDASVLIQLINSGQVFRFLLKPLQIGQCKIWLASALRRFVESSGDALAAFDSAVNEPTKWIRFKNWFLGVQG